MGKNLSNRYSQKLLDSAKKSTTDAIKTNSKRAIQKTGEVINLLDNINHQPSRFRTKIWVEKNYESRGTYNASKQIKFKTTIIKSSLCDYSDACTLVKRTIAVNSKAAADANANNTNKKVIFKNCAPFINCISEINNTQVDNGKDIDIAMYNLIEYSDDFKNMWKFLAIL